MFKRIDRYIISKFLGTYFFSIVLIISIGVVFDFNENIDRFTESHAPWRAIVMQYYLNFIPYYANLFSALFVFISVIFFTSKMADGSEIIAMISAGISYRRLLVPYMVSSAVIAAMTFYLGSEVIPRSSVKRLAFENSYKKRVKNPTYAEKVQLQVEPGVIAYMEHFDGVSKTGIHFSLDKFEKKKLVSHLSASTAVYDTLSDVRYQWHLRDVTVRELRGLKEKIVHYDLVDSVIRIEPQDFSRYQQLLSLLHSKDYGWTAETDDRIVIFTERIETMKYLAAHLKEDLHLKDQAVSGKVPLQHYRIIAGHHHDLLHAGLLECRHHPLRDADGADIQHGFEVSHPGASSRGGDKAVINRVRNPNGFPVGYRDFPESRRR